MISHFRNRGSFNKFLTKIFRTQAKQNFVCHDSLINGINNNGICILVGGTLEIQHFC